MDSTPHLFFACFSGYLLIKGGSDPMNFMSCCQTLGIQVEPREETEGEMSNRRTDPLNAKLEDILNPGNSVIAPGKSPR